MNCCRETTKMVVPPGNRRVLVSVPEWYVAGSDTRGRQEERLYPWSHQVIHEISGLRLDVRGARITTVQWANASPTAAMNRTGWPRQ
jgi:hypothetical protein